MKNEHSGTLQLYLRRSLTMKMETQAFVGKVYMDLTVMVVAMACISALWWSSFFLGEWAFPGVFLVSSLGLGAIVCYAQNRGYDIFFGPIMRRHPVIVMPVALIVIVLLFLLVSYHVVCAMGLT
jgi:hypothetical protein